MTHTPPEHTAARFDLERLILSNSRHLGMEDIRDVIDVLLAQGYSIAKLNHCGWMTRDDHTLWELETDEDSEPDDAEPVFVAGKGSIGLPALSLDYA